jgi:hypothetical protein
MFSFIIKHSLLISFLMLFTLFGVGLFVPSILPALGVIFFLFTLSTAIAFIIEKHKGHELMRRKVTRDILVLAITLLLAVLLGRVVSQPAANVAGAYVEVRWQGVGMAAGFIAAILVSFAVGYMVRWGMGKLSRE